MKRTAFGHPKITRLRRLLELPQYAVVGLLECLWHFTARHAIRGDVGKWSDEEIADGVSWPNGDAEKLITALTEARLLDPHPDHRLVVHDWYDHADDSVHRTLARRLEYFASGERPKLTRLGKQERERIEAEYDRPKRDGEPTGTHDVRTKYALGSPA